MCATVDMSRSPIAGWRHALDAFRAAERSRAELARLNSEIARSLARGVYPQNLIRQRQRIIDRSGDAEDNLAAAEQLLLSAASRNHHSTR